MSVKELTEKCMFFVEKTGLLRQLVVGGAGRERRWDGAYNINSFTARVLKRVL